MKKNTLPALVAVVCTLAGAVCMLLRQWLLTTGIDQKGLLVAGHIGNIASWCITAAVLLALGLFTVLRKPQCQFHTSRFSHIGSMLQILAFGMASTTFDRTSILSVLCYLAALLTGICYIIRLLLHINVKQIPPLLYSAPVVFYLLFILCCYQHWSSQPQLQLFGFQLLALVCLTVSAYHRAAIALNIGNSRLYFFFSNAALFLCLAAIPGDSKPLFFLLMAASTLLDGCATADPEEA